MLSTTFARALISAALGTAIIAGPVFCQEPTSAETERFYASMAARLTAGEDPKTLTDELSRQARDHFPGPGDFGICPSIPPGGIPGVTNQRYYFLSEILPGGIGLDSPACGFHLGCFLDQVAGTVHDTATLIIDRDCVSKRTLVVPDRFVLAGVGLDGAGRLVFDLPDSARALRFKPAVGAAIRHSQIRDLVIGNAQCCGQVGIDLSNSTLVQVDNVRIAGFAFGIFGQTAFMVSIDGSNLSNNGFGIVTGFDTTTWRMRENTIGFSGLVGISFDPTTRASLVSGGVLESNPFTAIVLRGIGNVIESSWFEGNGDLAGDFAIRISGSQNSRVLTSLFSDNDILDIGVGTKRCFNTAVGPLIPDNC